jgi:hypothetical protein
MLQKNSSMRSAFSYSVVTMYESSKNSMISLIQIKLYALISACYGKDGSFEGTLNLGWLTISRSRSCLSLKSMFSIIDASSMSESSSIC